MDHTLPGMVCSGEGMAACALVSMGYNVDPVGSTKTVPPTRFCRFAATRPSVDVFVRWRRRIVRSEIAWGSDSELNIFRWLRTPALRCGVRPADSRNWATPADRQTCAAFMPLTTCERPTISDHR